MNTNPNNTVIIQTCVSTTNADDDAVEKVNEDLKNLIDQTKAEDKLIILGDMNAIVEEGKEKTIVGKYRLGNRNDRGIYSGIEDEGLIGTN